MSDEKRRKTKTKSSGRAEKSAKGAKGPAKRRAAPKRGKKAPEAAPTAAAAPQENARAKALAHQIAKLVSDKKALDVVVLDVRGIASYADYVVIASGESDRQVTAMAEHVQTTLKQQGVMSVGSEGFETGSWVLLDYGEVVTHLFDVEVRRHYDLEGLWADAPREAVG